MLSKKEIRTLNKARTILSELEKRCSEHRRETPKNWSEADGYDYGRAAEASTVAEGAIFNVLNTVSAYRVQPLEDEELHNREEVPA